MNPSNEPPDRGKQADGPRKTDSGTTTTITKEENAMTSEQGIEELRSAVVDAARAMDARNHANEICGCSGCKHLAFTVQALDDALRPDPLRDAVELLRRVYAARDGGSPMSYLMPEMRDFIAAYDQLDGAA